MSQTAESGARDVHAVASGMGRVWCWEVCSESIEDEGKGCIAFRLTFDRPVSDYVLQGLGDGCAEAFVSFSSFCVDETIEFGAGDVVEYKGIVNDLFADRSIDFE